MFGIVVTIAVALAAAPTAAPFRKPRRFKEGFLALGICLSSRLSVEKDVWSIFRSWKSCQAFWARLGIG
jgi:hypothetical protein